MQLTQSATLRMEQRQLLTPRMIQSMEILQMPLLALEERIEQELESNPVLEVKEDLGDADQMVVERDLDNDTLRLDDSGKDVADDFERLARISEYMENEEWGAGNDPRSTTHGPRTSSYDGERDGKLDAMANTAARGANLVEHLTRQWSLIDMPAATPEDRREIYRAGEVIISFLDDNGYLRQSLPQVREEASARRSAVPELSCFDIAFRLIRTLEPAGIGAVDLQDCLLLQLDALERDEDMAEGHDFPLERTLIRDYLKDLEQNRYPLISKKTGRPIPELQAAVRRMSRLHPHPGKLISRDDAPPITPDARIRFNDETGEYDVEMTRDLAPDLYIRAAYRKMLKQRQGDKATREFLSNNVRNARWLIESIEQRRGTIERVIRKVVEHQRDFFDRGPEFLRPLPMIGVAEELGIHVATVSRAVSEKWIDTPRGLFPLRRFFSGGTTSEDGEEMSWDAVKEKLKGIVDQEDKQNPLSDDQIVEKLAEQGIELARRTVAKYRKILNIPTARQRKEF